MLIALTGGIGSGKSTALATLKQNGYNTVSCDDITRELYGKRRVLKALREVFPSAISGKIRLKADKKEISRIVFSDEQKYEFLNDFLAQETFKVAMKRAKKLKGTVVVEVPLLLENDLAGAFDKVIIIMRDKKARIESVKARSGLTDAETLARINAQVDYDKVDLTPFTVIKNDGSEIDLAAAVLKAVKE